jgi:hypothetical protein
MPWPELVACVAPPAPVVDELLLNAGWLLVAEQAPTQVTAIANVASTNEGKQTSLDT